MKQNKPIYDEDIDLIELLFILWRGKFIIIFFALITGIFSGMFFWIKDNSKETSYLYETKLFFSINPSYISKRFANLNYTSEKFINNFKEIYFSKDNFNKWSDTNKQKTLLYEELLDTELSNDLNYKKENTNYTFFKIIPNERKHYLYINSDNLNSINEISNYFDFVSKNFNSKHLLTLKNKRENIINFYSEFNNTYPNSASSEYINSIIQIDDFIDLLLNDHNILSKDYVEKPINLNKLIKSFSFFKLVILILIGSIIGSVYLIIRNGILNKNKLQ